MRINADDWGRTRAETDAALDTHRAGRITSATAMVFMADSHRAACLALEHGVDAGLHLNLSQPFDAMRTPRRLADRHERVARYLRSSRFARMFDAPSLRADVAYVVEAQLEEYRLLYGRDPGHIDGHHHLHLCASVLNAHLLPAGVPVRRNHTFEPGRKGWLNRAYRAAVDRRLARRHPITDRFFTLAQCLHDGTLEAVFALARHERVELMTHPAQPAEREALMSERFGQLLDGLRRGGFEPTAPAALAPSLGSTTP